jgi:hypothetical protein
LLPDFSRVVCLQAADLLGIEDHVQTACYILAIWIVAQNLQLSNTGIQEDAEKVLRYLCAEGAFKS